MIRIDKTHLHRGLSWLIGLALTSASLLGAGACSAETSEEEKAFVKLGVFAREYSDFNDEGKVSLVVMAMPQINESGGLRIKGKEYDLDAVVGHFLNPTPEEASEVFSSLVDAGVVGVLGPPGSSQVLGTSQDQNGAWRKAVSSKVVLISESATNPAITDLDDDNYVFRLMPPDSLQGKFAANEAYDSGKRKVSMLYRDDSYGQSLVAEFAKEFKSLGGTIVADVPYDVSHHSPEDLETYAFSDELDEVFVAGPDLVYLVTYTEIAQISKVMTQHLDLDETSSEELGFMASDSVYDPAVLDSATPEVLSRLRGTSAGVDAESADYRTFVEALSGAELGDPWNASAQLYDAVFILALAMQAADSIDPRVYKDYVAKVTRKDKDDVVGYVDDFARAREALLSGKGVNYEGASGPIELNDAGDPTAGLLLIWRPEETEDGSFVFSTEKSIPF